MTLSNNDKQKAEAVLRLATSLFEYGQHARVIPLLNLHDWLVPDNSEAHVLRINALIKLHHFDEALKVYDSLCAELGGQMIAEIHWGLGDMSQGDVGFRKQAGVKTNL